MLISSTFVADLSIKLTLDLDGKVADCKRRRDDAHLASHEFLLIGVHGSGHLAFFRNTCKGDSVFAAAAHADGGQRPGGAGGV